MKKADLIKDILQSISKVPDHLLRSFFVKELSQRIELSEQSAIYELNRLRRSYLKGKFNQGDMPLPEPVIVKSPQEEARQELVRNGEIKEEKIIEMLFKYGSQIVHLKRADGEEIEVSVVDYIVGELDRDQIRFKNPKFSKVFDYFREKCDRGEEVSQKDLIENEDEEIRNYAYDFSLVRHALSENWEDMYHISTNSEETDLKRSIDNAMYHLRLAEVLDRLDQFQEKLKGAEEEEIGELSRKLQLLTEAKKALADKLGMTTIS